KRGMPAGVERLVASEAILRGMGWIEMGTGNQALRHGLRRRMSAAVLQQFRQHMGVRPVGTLAVRGRGSLEHLDPPDLADEHPMRAGAENEAHRRISRLEQRSAGMRQEPRGHVRDGDADARVELQGTEAEVEERRLPVLWAQGLSIRPERGEL